MPSGFDNKDYGDYFKALEENLNKPQKRKIPEPEPQQSERTFPKLKLRFNKAVVATVLAVILLVTTVSVGISIAVKNGNKPQEEVTSKPTEIKEEKEEKLSYTFPAPETPDILDTNDAACAIIVDKSTNQVVAARNAHQRAFPASTTKIMTLLVAVENITDLNETFTMTYAITDPLFVQGASIAGFLNGETIPLIDMLYGAVLPSGADAAVGLAMHIAGSEEAFVEMMNQKVEELGLENTHFTNVVGLHNEDNYSTAYDMAIITDAAMQNELCRQILSTYQYTTTKTPQNPDGILLSSTLYSYMYGNEPETAVITGGKTGYVNESGYCIASYGTGNQSGKEYIVVTLGNSSLWPAIHGQIALYKEYAK